MPAQTPAKTPFSGSRYRRWRLSVHISPSRSRAARRLGAEHALQSRKPRLHLARRLVELAEHPLVIGRELAAAPPARQVVRDDPYRRDDDQEDDAEDED